MKKIVVTLIAMVMLTSAFAQEKPIPLVNVNGEHNIKVEPDGANINFMISTTNKDLQAAKKENDALISKAIVFLKEQNIADKDLRTTNVDLQPYNEYVKDEKPVPMFRAQQSLTFKLTNLGKLTDILSGLVNLGVNNIQSVQFISSKMNELQDEARAKAMLDAKRKAMILAKAINQKVGVAFTINDNTSTNGNYPRPLYSMAYKSADMAESGGQAPIASGEIEITANVQVSFLLF
jgi:uncharacterized protein YggE